MLEKYYLAIDIGASSGRHILGTKKNGKIVLEEIYRFENKLVSENGHLCWEFDKLFEAILNGLKKCKEIGKIPTSMGIDTWGVDFVLLDEEDKVIGPTIGYRDSRTDNMDLKVQEKISAKDLYARTGIQKQLFNTIYQLMAVKEQTPEYLDKAKSYLMTPEYFNFLLTGVKKHEYTIASTTQLVSPITKQWDYELLDLLGIKKDIFKEICPPGESVGHFSKEIKELVGFDCEVILAPTHDTASAVLAVPTSDDDAIYISSGTWSLMGIELEEANLSQESMMLNLSNEGGYDYRFRYLKNIMGLWMIQSVRNELKISSPFDNNAQAEYSFAKLCEEAAANDEYKGRVDVNDNRFLAPKSMIEEINNALIESGYKKPANVGELAACIYQSLAYSYGETIKELEDVTGKAFSKIHIVGGGSNASYLNELTAKYTKRKVYAGPTEATAIGNLLCQMLKANEYGNIVEARKAVYDSFEVKEV